MNRHRALCAQGRLIPDLPVDLRHGEHLPRMGHKQLQDCIFRGRQGDGIAVQRDRSGPVVHGNRPADQVVRRLYGGTQLQISPQLGFHPGQHLDRIERLCDIVIRSEIKAQNLVGVLAFGGQENHRHVADAPDLGQCRDAVHLRHHHVQQHQSDAAGGHGIQGGPAAAAEHGLIAGSCQIDIECRTNICLIVTDQYFVRFHSGVHLPF